MARPMQAEAHRPAAVVRPFTSCFPVTMMVPAPRKPMPLITWAPKRDTSVRRPICAAASCQSWVTIKLSYWLSSMVSAAPRHTSI